jgi:hypothetical protein
MNAEYSIGGLVACRVGFGGSRKIVLRTLGAIPVRCEPVNDFRHNKSDEAKIDSPVVIPVTKNQQYSK